MENKTALYQLSVDTRLICIDKTTVALQNYESMSNESHCVLVKGRFVTSLFIALYEPTSYKTIESIAQDSSLILSSLLIELLEFGLLVKLS